MCVCVLYIQTGRFPSERKGARRDVKTKKKYVFNYDYMCKFYTERMSCRESTNIFFIGRPSTCTPNGRDWNNNNNNNARR